ncbi:MAG TPA: permease prefix domain 1-containing protein [Dehalococcoidia bacterium]|nr:permease prefix domain 1-containing protein [Dehalococcoidia bacterium]
MSEPRNIEAYLDALAERLVLPPQRLRRVLAETEDHLRSSITSLIEEGVERDEAARLAIQRFGAPDVVAKGFARGPIASVALVMATARSLYGVAVVGLLAIGLSGVIAAVLGAAFGKSFVAGDVSGVTYTPARCDQFLTLWPHAANCMQAALMDHYDEVVFYRVLAGLLGLVALGGLWFLRRRVSSSRLPDWFAPTVGASIFSIAGLGLLAAAANPDGQVGGYISGAAVAAVVAVAYGLQLARYLTPAVQPD